MNFALRNLREFMKDLKPEEAEVMSSPEIVKRSLQDPLLKLMAIKKPQIVLKYTPVPPSSSFYHNEKEWYITDLTN